ncbi:MAG TPA: cobalamin-independent methionine synthase II family protein [Chloroflexota bacterium]|jgi:5-methyltetrahydropteroyltriglutamate--homocysteine methyltransferase
MRRSAERILTTHTGSLPRPTDLLEMIEARESGQHVDGEAFAGRVESAVAEAVRRQVEAGIDVVSDGEMGKPSFATYVTHRLAGFGGQNTEPRVSAEWESFPGWASQLPRSTMKRQYCLEPLAWKDRTAVQTDIRNLIRAAAAAGAEEAFVPTASPGIVADLMVNRHYPSEAAYLYALADVMRDEYRAIADAGLLLQVDAPDAALCRHTYFRNSSLEEFRRATALRLEALNHALQGIPEERVRFHVCWGNYEGPHTHDVPLGDIVDLVLSVPAGAYSIEAANPRHAHEWRVWEEVKLPPGKVLIPGVIDSTTNFVEHPEVVAERIEQYARVVGRENVIAGTDCGFGTSAGRSSVHPEIVWPKLRALTEGARLATERLWGPGLTTSSVRRTHHAI